jgi:ectoine hydroxylase-related dioxygenase (phytanoyl-CoA dioxygenase family)
MWIALDDADEENGCMWVIPGSHLGWKLIPHESYYDDPPFSSGSAVEFFQRHRIPLDQIDFTKEALLPMSPGDGLFFTNYTWHRSEPNFTGRSLYFYAIAYQRAEEPPKPVE